MKKVVIIVLSLLVIIALIFAFEMLTLHSRFGKTQTSELKQVNNSLEQLPSFSLVTKEAFRDSLITKKVQEKVESQEFVNLEVDDLQKIQAYLTGNRPIDENSIVVFRVLIYRFYNQLKVERGKLVCTVSSGSELGISEDVFQLYKKELADLNNGLAKMKNEDRPDEEALRENLEEQVKQLIE